MSKSTQSQQQQKSLEAYIPDFNVVIGAVSTGKSTAAVVLGTSMKRAGKSVFTIMPDDGTAEKNKRITAKLLHGSLRCDLVVDKDMEFGQKFVDELTNDKIDMIIVDEFQFLEPNQIMALYTVGLTTRIPITMYGLSSDYLGRPFPSTTVAICVAGINSVKELTVPCCIKGCKQTATCSLKVDKDGKAITDIPNDGNIVDLGDDSKYKHICRPHHTAILIRSQNDADAAAKKNESIVDEEEEKEEEKEEEEEEEKIEQFDPFGQ